MEARNNRVDEEDEENEPLLTPVKPIKLMKTNVSGVKLLKRKAGGKSVEAILVFGDTGAGKTKTINIFTGSNLAVGTTHHSTTTMIVTQKDMRHPNHPVWVDTPGLKDTKGLSDIEIFKSLLYHLQQEQIHVLKAVIWCVTPNSKMDMALQNQAKIIDMLTEGEDHGKIWSNVLVLSNGKRNKTAEEDCKGAVEAAKKICPGAEPHMLGYALAGEDEINILEKEQRVALRTLTEQEIRVKLEEEIATLPPSIKVVFTNKQCRACGQVGDPRLMEDVCHKNKIRGHPLDLRYKKKHSKPKIGAAYAAGIVGVAGLGVAAVMVPGSELVLLGVPMVMSPGTVMSMQRIFSRGDMKYKCCGTNQNEDAGCEDLCDKCGAVWGSTQGCVMIRHPDLGMQEKNEGYEVQVKGHDLIDI